MTRAKKTAARKARKKTESEISQLIRAVYDNPETLAEIVRTTEAPCLIYRHWAKGEPIPEYNHSTTAVPPSDPDS